MRVFHVEPRTVFLLALVGCVASFLAALTLGLLSGAVVWSVVGVVVAVAVAADILRPRVAKRSVNTLSELSTAGRYEEAVAAADKWMNRYGADPLLRSSAAWSLSIKAWALSELKRPQQAIDVYDGILDGFMSDDEPGVRVSLARALIRKAYCLGELGCVDEQLGAYDEVIERFSASDAPRIKGLVADAWVNKEITLRKDGRYEDAISLADEVFTRFAEARTPELRIRAAQALDHKALWLHKLGRLVEAIATWDDLDDRFRESPDPELRLVAADALVGKASSLADKRSSASMDAYRMLISRYENDGLPEMDIRMATAYVGVALLLVAQDGSEDEADACFNRAIELNPDTFNLNSYARFLELAHRGYDKAEAYFKRAIEVERSAESLGSYANFLESVRHDPDTAESYFLEAIEAASDDVERAGLFSSYAYFLEFARHDFDQAEEFCKRAIAADPAEGNHLQSYARFLQLRRNDLDAAEACHLKSLQVDPHQQTHLAAYANFLAAFRKDAAAAETQYRAAERLCRRSIKAGDAPRLWPVLLTQVVLAQGRTAAGLALLLSADKPLLKPESKLLLRLLQFAHETRRSVQAKALADAKDMLSQGVRTYGADLEANCLQARRAGHPDPDFLDKLAGVISNGDDVKELDAFAVWRAA